MVYSGPRESLQADWWWILQILFKEVFILFLLFYLFCSQSFFQDLKQSGFHSTIIRGPDHRHMSTQYLTPPSTPYHYLFLSQYNIYIHLVVFYERRTSYLWYGHILRTDLVEEVGVDWGQMWNKIEFGKEVAGAFSK